MTSEAVPLRATYRLQLTPDFGFAAARELIPYLRDLGVSHLYLSPSLEARAGSTHGYDVIDPTRISDQLGGDAEFRALAVAAHQARMGIILDIVPNHMAVDPANRFWSDPELRARFFDIDPETGAHRRFFDIDDLAGLRQEDESVFAETHGLILTLVREGVVDGLRIDHPDGLADPAQYLDRLRDRGVEHVWVEKILEADERLRDWPVSGTVGYEFLNDVCALFVDPGAEAALTALWEDVSGERRSFAEMAAEAKLEQASGAFAREVARLERVLGRGAVGADELAAAVASLPVYRTYVEPGAGRVDSEDRAAVAVSGMPDEIASRLLLDAPAPEEFVTRFQQTTPPVVAKGIEDTAFYRYARLLALCDVGGDPGRFGLSGGRFHDRASDRGERFPLGMLTTVTHDTKRTADVRARMAALSWMPAEWESHVRRWLEVTSELRSDAGAPDDVERYVLFQTLAGAWPIELDRIEGYMLKALREAKRNTSWVDQNSAWEEAVLGFCRRLYASQPFLEDFEPFAQELSIAGDRIALGMLALKLTAPGVPDIYQGDELPFRALVDPDNRRPVDWRWHQAMLSRLEGGSPPDGGTMKLWLTTRLLQLRIRRPSAFAPGSAYEPVDGGDGVVAFTRGVAREVLVAVASRQSLPAGAALRGVGGRWRDVLAGGDRVLRPEEPLSGVLGPHGVSVLERS